MQNFILRVPRVPRTVSEKVHFCMFLGLSQRKFRVLVHPARLGTKGADLWGISNTNLPFLINQSFLVQKQNYKLAFRKLTKRQVEAFWSLFWSLFLKMDAEDAVRVQGGEDS